MLETVKKIPVVRNVVAHGLRTKIALDAATKSLAAIAKWLLRSRETTNFTFNLTDISKLYMASSISIVSGKPVEEIKKYIEEMESDSDLAAHIRNGIRSSDQRYVADFEVRYGKRLGWYAAARAMKPKTVIETGVDKGLGSCVLAAALLRNAEEGFPGRYYGTDIKDTAGYLLSGKYKAVGEVLYGDSLESLNKLDVTIDLFINDSDHSAEYEAREYEAITSKLAEKSIVIGDNAHVTRKLFDFAAETGRKFLFYREESADHWHSGGCIGFAYRD